MEERVPVATEDDTTAELERLWQEQRRRAAEVLAAQKTHFGEIEAQLAAQVEQINSQIAAGLGESAKQQKAEIERLRAELEKQQLDSKGAHEATALQLQQWSDQLHQKQDEIQKREEQLARDLTAAAKAAAQTQAGNASQAAALDSAQQEIERLHSELRSTAEVARGVEQELEALRARNEELEQQASAGNASAEAGQNEIARERDDLARRLGEAEAEVEALRAQAAGGEATAAGQAELMAQLENTQREAADAAARIAELEEQLAAAQQAPEEGGAASDEHMQELERRLEMAMDDVRTLKRRNTELEEKVANSKAAGGGSAGGGNEGQDWESIKRRMLAGLEADTDETPERKEERIQIENTVQITDGIVAEKDREIAELKQLLEEQSKNVGSVAVGAAAVEQIYDQDEIVRQERARLQQAQGEWREKLRQAEIDVSLERARLARERQELEEKLRALEGERAEVQSILSGHPTKKGKPERGRWLERLGLKDGEKR